MSRTTNKRTVGAMAALMTISAASAQAAEWDFQVGGHYVDPKSGNHSVVNVDSARSLTFSAIYFVDPKWQVELLAALPFEHDIRLNASGSKVAKVKHLPPTLSVRYNFAPERAVRPFVSAGLNATLFFDEKTQGALAGNSLNLDTSFGAAAQAGIDFDIAEGWFVALDARWMDIDTKAHLGATNLGSVSIDPLAFGLSIGHSFGR